MFKKLFLPASLLAGTIIGAGIFALPFVFHNAGIAVGLFYLGLFTVAFIFIHLMYADTILKTENSENHHRFPGYVRIYLGRIGFWLSILTGIFGIFFTLTIYLVLSISFFNLIFPEISAASALLVFWFLGSMAIFLKIKRVAFSEFLITGGVIAIILVIFSYGMGYFEKIVSTPLFNINNLLLPYGAILFSLSGRVAIPAIINYFKKIKQPLINIKKPIILGTLLPSLVYIFFIIGVLGLSGVVSEDAISGIAENIPKGILVLIGIFGLLSLWSSYIVIGIEVKDSLKFDLKFPTFLTGLLVVLLPPLLYFWGFQSFLELVGIAGGVFIALEGIFIVLMWLKTFKLNPKKLIFSKINFLIIYALILIFIGGIICELFF
ncbi:hypothetical protein JW698_01845 [Candidatus Wolfebacteria bacterium]|nr:hypothetical protein [Candidatus Wolfebacteria bacterium]